jgi:hypothetical protein
MEVVVEVMAVTMEQLVVQVQFQAAAAVARAEILTQQELVHLEESYFHLPAQLIPLVL